MSDLYLLTDRALDELKKTASLEKYNRNTPFIEEQFSGRQYKSSINISVELPDLYVKPKEEEPLWIQDYNNAIELYKSLKDKVSLRYLTDERFWTYLTHTKYWTYLINRWPANTENRILENWFFKGGNQIFSRHALVKLWWRVECSYDSSLADPFELTKIAFEYQDPINQLIERKIGKSRKVFKCALIAIRDNQNSSKLKTDTNRTKFGKYINILAGVKLIEVMPNDELIKMFDEAITYITSSN